MKHWLPEVSLKANARVQHPGLSIVLFKRGNRRVGLAKWQKDSVAAVRLALKALSSDNIADIVRRVVGAFGNLPSNPSNESGSASSSGFLMLTPNTNFMIGLSHSTCFNSIIILAAWKTFFPELDRVGRGSNSLHKGKVSRANSE